MDFSIPFICEYRTSVRKTKTIEYKCVHTGMTVCLYYSYTVSFILWLHKAFPLLVPALDLKSGTINVGHWTCQHKVAYAVKLGVFSSLIKWGNILKTNTSIQRAHPASSIYIKIQHIPTQDGNKHCRTIGASSAMSNNINCLVMVSIFALLPTFVTN